MKALHPIELHYIRRLAAEGEPVAAIALRMHLNESVVREVVGV